MYSIRHHDITVESPCTVVPPTTERVPEVYVIIMSDGPRTSALSRSIHFFYKDDEDNDIDSTTEAGATHHQLSILYAFIYLLSMNKETLEAIRSLKSQKEEWQSESIIVEVENEDGSRTNEDGT
jgi:Tfp pilus assembly PilM family ATPase